METTSALSDVLEKYLIIIYQEEFKHEQVTVSNVAKIANVTKSSVTHALKKLSEMGYVEYSKYSKIALTEKGLRHALSGAHKIFVIEEFLINILHLDPAIAQNEAYNFSFSPIVFNNLKRFILFMKCKKQFWINWEEEFVQIAENHKTVVSNNELNVEKNNIMDPKVVQYMEEQMAKSMTSHIK